MASRRGGGQEVCNFGVQIGRGPRHLGRNQPLKRTGGRQHDTPLAQPVLRACHQFSGGSAFQGTLAQPVPEIGGGMTIKGPDAKVATNTQGLRSFRPRPARPVEEQNRCQSELTRQVADDFYWRVPVIIKEVPVSTQHAELQSEAATMVWASAFGGHGQVRGRQAPVPRQFVLGRVRQHRCSPPVLNGRA